MYNYSRLSKVVLHGVAEALPPVIMQQSLHLPLMWHLSGRHPDSLVRGEWDAVDGKIPVEMCALLSCLSCQ